MMSGRERVLAVLRHGIPDRVPCYEVLVDPPMVEHVLGIADRNSSQLEPRQVVDLACRMGLDCVIAGLRFFRPVQAAFGGTPDPESLQPPAPAEQDAWLERCARIAELAHEEGLAAAAYNHGAFDVVYESLGFENFMLLLYDDLDYVERFTEHLYRYHFENTRKALATGIDFMLIGDDVAYGSGPFLDPDLFFRLWRDREARMIALVREAGLPCEYHSDGRVDWLIPHLADMGVDLVNPIEPYCNDIVDLKARFGHRIAFRGNVDVGGNLSSGTPESVYGETRDLVLKMKPGGGYVCSSSHSVSRAVRPENYLELVRAVRDFGGYAP